MLRLNQEEHSTLSTLEGQLRESYARWAILKSTLRPLGEKGEAVTQSLAARDGVLRTVYLMGAGLNRAIRTPKGLAPPVANDVFQVALADQAWTAPLGAQFLAPVLEYIEHYWRRTAESLAASAFDLEEFLGVLQDQRDEARRRGDLTEIARLVDIRSRVMRLLGAILDDFRFKAITTPIVRDLAEIIYQQRCPVLSFNYDVILDEAIESTSGLMPGVPPGLIGRILKSAPRPEELCYSNYTWNLPLGYGFLFDDVELGWGAASWVIDGTEFYSHPKNALYQIPILKLHGSLNWYRYGPVRREARGREVPTELPVEIANRVLLLRRVSSGGWAGALWPAYYGEWRVEPIVVAPEPNKTEQYNEPLTSRILDKVWLLAADALGRCEHLVVIGYSFPAGDLRTRRLFREVFAKHTLRYLSVVNPAQSVVTAAQELTHFQGDVFHYRRLAHYLRYAPR